MNNSLYLSLIHASIQSILVLPDLYYNPPWKIDPNMLLNLTSSKIKLAHYLFLFYILLDSYKHKSILKYDEWFHHIITFIGVYASLYYGPHYIGYMYLANEFSTIFLHSRHLFKKRLKLLCKVCFLITFTIFRIFLNTYLIYWTSLHIGFGTHFFMQFPPYLINIWWYRRILLIAFNYK